MSQLRRIRWAVRAVLTLGIVASVAANVLHAEPNGIAQTIAAWPPLALLLTVELISRVPVHRRWLAAVRMLATSAIAGIAAFVSYNHMVGVAVRYGETGAAPYLIPISVDGLVVVASVCLVELGGRIAATAAEVDRPVLPPTDPIPVLVTPDPEPTALPTAITEASPPGSGGLVDQSESVADRRTSAKSASRRPTSTPKRTFEQTRRAAAALDADGMAPSDIATTLGITPRQVRTALKPVPVDGGSRG